MARVTVEDCVEVVSNRYELVLLAAQRARDIAAGAQITVSRDNDKNPVVALREIADETINLDQVRDHIVNGVNRMGDLNEEDDLLMALAGQAGGNLLEDSTVAGVSIEEVSFDGSASISAAEEDMGEEFEGGAEGLGDEAEFGDVPGELGDDLGAGESDFGGEDR